MNSLANSTMEDHERRKKEAEEEEEEMVDHFQRLPNELVVQIFDKVSEAKWLCICYLVSKRFAVLVPKTHALSFKIPGWSLENPPSAHVLSVILPMVFNFLRKFNGVQSLHVEVVFAERPQGVDDDEYLTKWKAKANQESFIFLAAKRVIAAGNNHQQQVGNASKFPRDEIYSLSSKMLDHTKDSQMRYQLLDSIASSFPKLKEAVVTDSAKRGRLFVEEADLDKMRRKNKCRKCIAACSKLWYQPVLKLPLTGFVMEGATLSIVKGVGINDVSIAENAFEEKEFCEAAMEMLKGKPFLDQPWFTEVESSD